MTPPAPVRFPLALTVTAENGGTVGRAHLVWEPADPWAVQLSFGGDAPTWVFGWELLVAGLTAPAGDVNASDVLIRPLATADDREQRHQITLRSPAWQADLYPVSQMLEAFVDLVMPCHAAAAAAAFRAADPQTLTAEADAGGAS